MNRKISPAVIALILIGLLAVFGLSGGSIRTLLSDRVSPPVSDTFQTSSGNDSLSIPDDRVPAVVERVVDGDTIEVRLDGRQYKVRYIGINAPESVKPNHPVERMGSEASEANHTLVDGKTVYLEQDVSETDQYGRLLRYVYVDDLLVNAELVRLGYARARRYPPDLKHQDVLEEMEREARAAGRGLWSSNSQSSP